MQHNEYVCAYVMYSGMHVSVCICCCSAQNALTRVMYRDKQYSCRWKNADKCCNCECERIGNAMLCSAVCYCALQCNEMSLSRVASSARIWQTKMSTFDEPHI